MRLSDRFQIKNWINFVLLKFRICDEDFFWNRNLVFLWNLCTLYVNLHISYLRVHDLYHQKSEKFKCIFLDRPHHFKYFSWPYPSSFETNKLRKFWNTIHQFTEEPLSSSYISSDPKKFNHYEEEIIIFNPASKKFSVALSCIAKLLRYSHDSCDINTCKKFIEITNELRLCAFIRSLQSDLVVLVICLNEFLEEFYFRSKGWVWEENRTIIWTWQKEIKRFIL